MRVIYIDSHLFHSGKGIYERLETAFRLMEDLGIDRVAVLKKWEPAAYQNDTEMVSWTRKHNWDFLNTACRKLKEKKDEQM